MSNKRSAISDQLQSPERSGLFYWNGPAGRRATRPIGCATRETGWDAIDRRRIGRSGAEGATLGGA